MGRPMTPEEQTVRQRVSDLRFQATQISQHLQSAEGRALAARTRNRLEMKRDSLLAEATHLRATLPKRIDPWGNVEEE